MSDAASLRWAESGLDPVGATGRVTAAARDEDRQRQEPSGEDAQRESDSHTQDDAAQKRSGLEVVDTLTLSAAAQKLLAAAPAGDAVMVSDTPAGAAGAHSARQDRVLLSSGDGHPDRFDHYPV